MKIEIKKSTDTIVEKPHLLYTAYGNVYLKTKQGYIGIFKNELSYLDTSPDKFFEPFYGSVTLTEE